MSGSSQNSAARQALLQDSALVSPGSSPVPAPTAAAPTRVLVAVPIMQAYGRTVIDAVIQYARRHTDWELLFAPDPAQRQALHRTGRAIHGLIADGNMPDILPRARRLGCPVVVMSGEPEPAGMGHIVIDNHAVGRLAAEYLLGLGFAHLGFCGVGHIWTSVVRGRAFREAIERQPPPPAYHELIDRAGRVHDWDAESAELIDWVRRLPKPIGIFANHDNRARQLALACQEAGVAVPERVAIIGVNNDELTCEMAHPPLSSIDHNARAMGAEAAAMLDRVLRGAPMPTEPVIIKPVGVVERRSTDTLALEDLVIARAVRLIRERATAGWGVREVLRELPIGRRSLEVGFKQALGRTPHQEVLRVRLDQARYLLRESTLDMPAIAERSGFRYASQLSAIFRKHEGLSPKAYRERVRD